MDDNQNLEFTTKTIIEDGKYIERFFINDKQVDQSVYLSLQEDQFKMPTNEKIIDNKNDQNNKNIINDIDKKKTKNTKKKKKSQNDNENNIINQDSNVMDKNNHKSKLNSSINKSDKYQCNYDAYNEDDECYNAEQEAVYNYHYTLVDQIKKLDYDEAIELLKQEMTGQCAQTFIQGRIDAVTNLRSQLKDIKRNLEYELEDFREQFEGEDE